MTEKVVVNSYFRPHPDFLVWLEENKDWTFPVNCNSAYSYEGLHDLADIDKEMQDKNPLLNEVATLIAVERHLEVLPDNPRAIGICNYRRTFDRNAVEATRDGSVVVGCGIPLGYYGNQVTIEQQYGLMHYQSDWQAFGRAVKSMKWNKFDEENFNRWKSLTFLPAPCNSFIAPRELFNMYVEDLERFLKSIKREVKETEVKRRDQYQRRAYAFLCERFLSFWAFNGLVSGWFNLKTRPLHEHLDWKEAGTEQIDNNGITRSK